MVKQRNPWNWGRSYGKPKAATPQPPAEKAAADAQSTDASGGKNVKAPWHEAGTHAKLDATVPDGVTPPENWGDLNLADKRTWLDANAV